MDPNTTSKILSELKKPSSPKALLTALRALKNDVVGHGQRKELWVRRGVIIILHKILDSYPMNSKKARGDNVPGGLEGQISRGIDEELKLQAVAIVGSLASEGPAFLPPLRTGGIVPQLLNIISPEESSHDLIQAVLQCLHSIANAISLESPDDQTEEEVDLLDMLYTDQALATLNQILTNASSDPTVQHQIDLAVLLIAKTSNTERRRKQIKISGIFETLALRLAAFVTVLQPVSVTTASNRAFPALPTDSLPVVLYAVCSVIADSKIRASAFCCYSVWGGLFSQNSQDPYSWRAPTAATAASSQSGLASFARYSVADKPKITVDTPSSAPTAEAEKTGSTNHVYLSDIEINEGFSPLDDDATPLIKWLLEVIRMTDGSSRLMAIWLVGIFFRAQMVSVKRRSCFSMLLVPMLVRMLDGDDGPTGITDYQTASLWTQAAIQFQREMIPRILALFVRDNEILQTGAVDQKAIKKLSQLLKQAFNPIPAALLTPMWKAHDAEEYALDMAPSKSCVLGRPGIPRIVHHVHRVRESYLIALSAMTTSTNANKQAIIDNGVVSFVIESLNTTPSEQSSAKPVEAFKPGNSTATIIAACGAVRTLSRSVAILRTSLVDAGLAKPLHSLLSHPDLEVRIAATAAVANILLPCSAMRQDIIDAGALQILCHHAHSSNSRLRINALSALSNFVAETTYDLKVKVVRELGSGWLRQLISTGVGNEFGSARHHQGLGLAPVSQTAPDYSWWNDALREVYTSRDNAEVSQSEDISMSESNDITNRSRDLLRRAPSEGMFGTSSDEYFDAPPDERVAAIQAARDELTSQECGLNLVRNLLLPASDSGQIVEYLFEELRQDKLFEIFTDLLRPRSMNSFLGSDSRVGAPAPKLIPPPTEIIINVCFILVHIAGSCPRHRQTVLVQKDLLQLIKPLFVHPHPDVRVALLWLVINLSWTEDPADRDAVVGRALELKRLGIIDKVHDALSDSDLDVRERAKQAIGILTDLIKC